MLRYMWRIWGCRLEDAFHFRGFSGWGPRDARASDLPGFRVWGLGFRVSGLGFRA